MVGVGGFVQLRGNDAEGRAGTTPTQVTPEAEQPDDGEPASPTPGKTSSTTKRPPAEARSTAAARPGNPTRLSVPSLGISTRVLAIRAQGGTLVPPSNPRIVGWWADGAQPGASKGSAIITGHTVHDGGGAFDDLELVKRGASIRVTTKQGTTDYVVASVTTYRKKALAKKAAQLFDQSVAGRLVLVTCEDWDGTAYLSNAVVVAVPKK
ncbi:sortase [Kribbella albertanoniae]|uniref:Sortase n=1 Tax=Kribbella albertanoniae TaxID=1266829 RepID=A0A4R4P6S7_9ACTN|nr:sortase [Kribbella albertanoniae]